MWFCFFKHRVDLLPQVPQCWGYRHVLSHLEVLVFCLGVGRPGRAAAGEWEWPGWALSLWSLHIARVSFAIGHHPSQGLEHRRWQGCPGGEFSLSPRETAAATGTTKCTGQQSIRCGSGVFYGPGAVSPDPGHAVAGLIWVYAGAESLDGL